MKNSKKLLEKKIELENSQVNGGLAMATHALCSSYTYGENCADRTTAMYNDQGQTIGTVANSSWQT